MVTPTQAQQIDLGALNQRVTSLESAIQNVATQLGALSSKIDERSRTPWAVLIAAAGFMLLFMSTIGVLAYRPIDQEQTRLAQDIRELKREINSDLRAINAQIVPRGEHTEKWESNRNQIVNLQRQIDEVQKRSGDVYSARDVILDLRNEVKDLKARVYSNGRHGTP